MRKPEEPLAYAALVSVKGDARSEAPSSAEQRLPRLLSACDRYGGLGFAAFALFHFGCQAFRARTDGALPSAGFELERPVVMAWLIVVWPPFLVFAWRRLRCGLLAPNSEVATEQARSLWILEQVTLAVVLAFTVLHVSQTAWPLLNEALAPDDVRPELIAKLSGTTWGVPMLAIAYLFGVGSAAFFGTRQVLRTRPAARTRALGRATVALGIVAYLCGSYAVIRCASGVILP
jgi:hypothetical protein